MYIYIYRIHLYTYIYIHGIYGVLPTQDGCRFQSQDMAGNPCKACVCKKQLHIASEILAALRSCRPGPGTETKNTLAF